MNGRPRGPSVIRPMCVDSFRATSFSLRTILPEAVLIAVSPHATRARSVEYCGCSPPHGFHKRSLRTGLRIDELEADVRVRRKALVVILERPGCRTGG